MPIHTFIINRRQSGQSLVAIMQAQLRLSQEDALECVRERGVRLAGNLCTDVDRRVRSGQRVHVTFNPKQAPRKKPRRNRLRVSRRRLVMGLLLIVALAIFVGLANKSVRENAEAIRQSFGR